MGSSRRVIFIIPLSLIVILNVEFVSVSAHINRPACKESTTCKCVMWDGSVVDLQEDAEANGTARFVENASADQGLYTYYYNPCYPINTTVFDNSTQSSIAAFRTNNVTEEYVPLGEQKSAKFWLSPSDNTLAINYSVHDQERQLHILFTIFFHCGDSKMTTPKFIPPQGEDPLQQNTSAPHFYARLISRSACPQRGEETRLSTGSIILILTFVGGLCYLIVGTLYKVFIVGAQRKEALPNAEFWMSLPGLISDGFRFTFSCCFGRRTRYQLL